MEEQKQFFSALRIVRLSFFSFSSSR
jgi:hypothetical protein